MWNIYKQFSALYSSEVKLLFLIKLASQKLGNEKVHFLPHLGIQDDAEISISFVFKVFVVFSTARRHLNLPHS